MVQADPLAFLRHGLLADKAPKQALVQSAGGRGAGALQLALRMTVLAAWQLRHWQFSSLRSLPLCMGKKNEATDARAKKMKLQMPLSVLYKLLPLYGSPSPLSWGKLPQPTHLLLLLLTCLFIGLLLHLLLMSARHVLAGKSDRPGWHMGNSCLLRKHKSAWDCMGPAAVHGNALGA